MGRVKTLLIKRVTRELMKQYPGDFNSSFEDNKKRVNERIVYQSKKLRNTIAGYVTRLSKV